MSFDSQATCEKSGSELQVDFVALINAASDGDDAVWNVASESMESISINSS